MLQGISQGCFESRQRRSSCQCPSGGLARIRSLQPVKYRRICKYRLGDTALELDAPARYCIDDNILLERRGLHLGESVNEA